MNHRRLHKGAPHRRALNAEVQCQIRFPTNPEDFGKPESPQKCKDKQILAYLSPVSLRDTMLPHVLIKTSRAQGFSGSVHLLVAVNNAYRTTVVRSVMSDFVNQIHHIHIRSSLNVRPRSVSVCTSKKNNTPALSRPPIAGVLKGIVIIKTLNAATTSNRY